MSEEMAFETLETLSAYTISLRRTARTSGNLGVTLDDEALEAMQRFRAALAEMEENANDLLPEGYRAEIYEWDEENDE